MDTLTSARTGGLRNRINAVLADIGDRSARYRMYRQTLTELGALSSRELSDLGLHRSQIEAVARQAAYGK